MPQANNVSLTVVADGLAGNVLKMRTPPTASQPVGAYVGSGTGNKALLGLSGFDGMKITDLNAVAVDIRETVAGSTTLLYMNFVVDLDCNKDEDLNLATLNLANLRSSRRVVVWNLNAGTPLPIANGYTRYQATPASLQWAIVGAPTLGMTANPGSGALTALTDYPFACIVDTGSGDNGLPRNTAIASCNTGASLVGTAPAQCSQATAGALLVLGDSNNTAEREVNIQRIRARDRVITFN